MIVVQTCLETYLSSGGCTVLPEEQKCCGIIGSYRRYIETFGIKVYTYTAKYNWSRILALCYSFASCFKLSNTFNFFIAVWVTIYTTQ